MRYSRPDESTVQPLRIVTIVCYIELLELLFYINNENTSRNMARKYECCEWQVTTIHFGYWR